MCVSAIVKINNLLCFNFHPFELLEMVRHCLPDLISHHETNFTYKTSIDVGLNEEGRENDEMLKSFLGRTVFFYQ